MVRLETVKTGTGPQVARNSHSHRRYSENKEMLHVLILSLIYEQLQESLSRTQQSEQGKKNFHPLCREMCLKT